MHTFQEPHMNYSDDEYENDFESSVENSFGKSNASKSGIKAKFDDERSPMLNRSINHSGSDDFYRLNKAEILGSPANESPAGSSNELMELLYGKQNHNNNQAIPYVQHEKSEKVNEFLYSYLDKAYDADRTNESKPKSSAQLEEELNEMHSLLDRIEPNKPSEKEDYLAQLMAGADNEDLSPNPINTHDILFRVNNLIEEGIDNMDKHELQGLREIETGVSHDNTTHKLLEGLNQMEDLELKRDNQSPTRHKPTLGASQQVNGNGTHKLTAGRWKSGDVLEDVERAIHYLEGRYGAPYGIAHEVFAGDATRQAERRRDRESLRRITTEKAVDMESRRFRAPSTVASIVSVKMPSESQTNSRLHFASSCGKSSVVHYEVLNEIQKRSKARMASTGVISLQDILGEIDQNGYAPIHYSIYLSNTGDEALHALWVLLDPPIHYMGADFELPSISDSISLSDSNEASPSASSSLTGIKTTSEQRLYSPKEVESLIFAKDAHGRHAAIIGVSRGCAKGVYLLQKRLEYLAEELAFEEAVRAAVELRFVIHDNQKRVVEVARRALQTWARELVRLRTALFGVVDTKSFSIGHYAAAMGYGSVVEALKVAVDCLEGGLPMVDGRYWTGIKTRGTLRSFGDAHILDKIPGRRIFDFISKYLKFEDLERTSQKVIRGQRSTLTAIVTGADFDGFTALHHASQHLTWQIATVLINAGANPYTKALSSSAASINKGNEVVSICDTGKVNDPLNSKYLTASLQDVKVLTETANPSITRPSVSFPDRRVDAILVNDSHMNTRARSNSVASVSTLNGGGGAQTNDNDSWSQLSLSTYSGVNILPDHHDRSGLKGQNFMTGRSKRERRKNRGIGNGSTKVLPHLDTPSSIDICASASMKTLMVRVYRIHTDTFRVTEKKFKDGAKTLAMFLLQKLKESVAQNKEDDKVGQSIEDENDTKNLKLFTSTHNNKESNSHVNYIQTADKKIESDAKESTGASFADLETFGKILMTVEEDPIESQALQHCRLVLSGVKSADVGVTGNGEKLLHLAVRAWHHILMKQRVTAVLFVKLANSFARTEMKTDDAFRKSVKIVVNTLYYDDRAASHALYTCLRTVPECNVHASDAAGVTPIHLAARLALPGAMVALLQHARSMHGLSFANPNLMEFSAKFGGSPARNVMEVARSTFHGSSFPLTGRKPSSSQKTQWSRLSVNDRPPTFPTSPHVQRETFDAVHNGLANSPRLPLASLTAMVSPPRSTSSRFDLLALANSHADTITARNSGQLSAGRYMGLLPTATLTSSASTPLHEAAIGGSVEVLSVLLNDSLRSRNTHYKDGWSQIGDSVLRTEIDARDGAKRSALVVASMFGRAAAVAWFLRADAYVYAADAQGNTALHYAVERRHLDVTRMLSNFDADLGLLSSHQNLRGETPSQKALKQAAVGSALSSKLRRILNSFWQLCLEGNVAEVESRLKDGWNSANDLSPRGWLPLHFAACGSNVRLVRILLSLGSAVEIMDGQGIGGDGRSVRLRFPELRRSDCEISSTDLEDWGLKESLKQRRLDQKNKYENNINSPVAAKFLYEDKKSPFVEDVAAISEQSDIDDYSDEDEDDFKDQPLHIAAACNQNLIIRTLIREAGARVDPRGCGLALFGLGLLDSPDALLHIGDATQPGARPDRSTVTHRFVASPQNQTLNSRSTFGVAKIKPASYSIASSPSTSPTKSSNKMPQICASHPTKAALKYVSKHFRGVTPLIVAAKFGAEASAGELVNQGADLRETDWFGDTAIHIAVRRGDVEVIQEIIRSCDDVNMLASTLRSKNGKGKIALEVYVKETKRRITGVERALREAYLRIKAQHEMDSIIDNLHAISFLKS